MRLADPRRALAAGLSCLTAIVLGTTGEVTRAFLVAPLIAVVGVLAARPIERKWTWIHGAFQLVFLATLLHFVASAIQLRLLAGALALTLPVQAYYLLRPPDEEGLSRLQLVGFFQVVGLAASTTTLLFVPIAVAWLLAAPVLFTLASLERRVGPPRVALALPGGLARAAAGVAAACAVLGIVGFLAIPRYEAGLMKELGRSGSARVSGFSEEVTLGDISKIQTSDRIVLRARVTGRLPHQMRWRGIALDHFSGKRWASSQPRWKLVESRPEAQRAPPPPRGAAEVVQELRVEPTNTRALFHLAEPVSVTAEAHVPITRDRWGNYRHEWQGRNRLAYRFVSHVGVPRALGLDDDSRQRCLQLPDMSPDVALLAARITAGAATDREKAERILQHLRVRYPYTLNVEDVGLERPVEAFLLDRRAGHCEYFSSGMVLLLRSQGIPARLVNGFRAGTYSRIFQVFVVRQRDAHSWVEAWLPGTGWTTFDPTPISVVPGEQAGSGQRDLWREVTIFWDDSVIGFNYTYQMGFLLTVRDWALETWTQAVRRPLVPLLFVTAVVLVAAAWLARRARGATTSVRFYARALRLLARRGWVRRPGQTPAELAEEIERTDATAGLAAVELTKLYYAARFGRAAPDQDRVRELLRVLRDVGRRAG